MMIADGRFATLDGIRGIAALSVMALHLQTLFPWHSFAHAFLAVDLFFLMSGFVLARNYERSLTSGELKPNAFMRHRAIRLYPLYLLGLLAGIANAFVQNLYGAAPSMRPLLEITVAVVAGALMLPAPFSKYLASLNSPAWSLQFELLANYLYSKLLPKLDNRTLVTIIAVTWLAIVALIFSNHLSSGFLWRAIPAGFVRVIFAFSIGVLMHRKIQGRLIASNMLALLVISSVIVLTSLNVPTKFEHLYQLAAMTLAIPAIAILAVIVEPTSLIRRLCLFSGEISYGAYILHKPIGETLETILVNSFNLPTTSIAFAGIPFTLCLITLVSVLNTKYDKRFRRALHALSSRIARPSSRATNIDHEEKINLQ